MLIRLFRLSRFRWQTHRSNGRVPNLVPQRILEVVEVVILRLPRAVKGHHCDQVRGLSGGQVAQAVSQRVIFARLSSATAIDIKVIELDMYRSPVRQKMPQQAPNKL